MRNFCRTGIWYFGTGILRILRITILKYHSWYLCQISLLIMLLPILIPLHEKFLQFDWLRAVVFQLEIPTCENYKTFAGSSINK